MSDAIVLRPSTGADGADDFRFSFRDVVVGRTYADATLQGVRWYWAIYGVHLRAIPAGIELRGQATDLEGATAAFQAAWESLLAADAVRLSDVTKGAL